MKRKIKNAILKALAVISFVIVMMGICAWDCGLTWQSLVVIAASVVYLATFIYANRHSNMFTVQDVICEWD